MRDVRPLTAYQGHWYDVVRNVLSVFCRLYLRLRVEGGENVPTAGAFILAPVHRSNVDTPISCSITGRRFRYMGKDAMWKYRWSAWLFDSLGGIPVNRGSPDREALRACEQVVALGEPLVMFPEGTRRIGPVIDELYDGAAFVSARTGSPIVPVGIGGAERAMGRDDRLVKPVKVVVVVGPPIFPKAVDAGARVPRRAVRELSERLRVELQALFDEAQIKAGVRQP